MIDVFNGIDRSTARHRIIGDGAVLYEAKNTFPYLQGRLQRRKDYVTTNSRDSNNAFVSFPSSDHAGADALTGNPVIRKTVEFNGQIIIFFEDDGNTGILLADRFNVGANTMTAVYKTTDAIAYTAGGKIDAVPYTLAGGTFRLAIALEGASTRDIDTSWADTSQIAQASEGICEVFLQSFFYKVHESVAQGEVTRTAVGTYGTLVAYTMAEAPDPIIKLVSFGYQTSSQGAYTNLIVFKHASTWLLTSVTSTAAFEQVSGNVGLVGRNAVVNTPVGLIFVGRDTRGFLNVYLLDRTSLTLHTIGHPLYEVLQDVPTANYDDIFVSYDRNRLVRIALTLTGDANTNIQEYWIDFYNGIKKRTFWGPFPLKVQTLSYAIAFSGGPTPANAGFFIFELSGTTYSIKEETETDSFDSADTDIDVQSIRTKIFDFGTKNALVNMIWVTALDNGAKFKIYSEIPKAGGTDDDTTKTLIGTGNADTPVTGEYQMGTTGLYKTIPVRLVPALRVNQFGIKIDSDADVTDDDPLEISQIGFEFTSTQRTIIE